MRCPVCGREAPDARFCEWCGHSFQAGTAPSVESKPGAPSASSISTMGAKAQPATATNENNDSSNQLERRGITWAALAILLYMVIADVGVETFLRGSPLRWWIAGTSVLYLVLCFAVWRLMPKLWRHLDWTGQAGLSLIVLLGLSCVAAWIWFL